MNVQSIKCGRRRGTPEQEALIDQRLRDLCARANGRPLALTEIARATGLSHGGVHYLQTAALKKIRHALARQGIRSHEGVPV